MERTPARAWLVWGIAVAAYTIGVLQRTSLGVSGLDAARRFEISAAVLGSFAVVQLLVYAAMQIPVGAMVDRVGPRAMVVSGALLMALGQTALALAQSYPAAILARVLVGAGDAMTFISVLRLIASWFEPRQVPVLTQVTGLVGQGGQILSVVPLVALLHTAGWTPAFLSAASLSVLAAMLTLAVVRDSPDGSRSSDASPTWARVRHDLVSAWRHPGTRLGLWTHFTTQFSGTVFVMLWGYPFLVSGEGLTREAAGVLFTAMVLFGMAAGPVIGVLVSRHPLRRSWLVLGIVGAVITVWTVVLSLSGPAPGWLLLVLVLVLSVSGPGSMIGFDYARTFNPPNRLGTATGIVNVGGFAAALVTILLVGLVLDLVGQGETYTLSGFRVALSVQYLFWGVGLVGFLRARHRVRARMASEGTHVPPLRDVVRRRRAARY
ncbi:MAG TPA: MFS transporter [Candidatus Angelobacter sp.]|nr:MFS transporter [Candidatus Angelobacter sp.]